MFSATRNMSVNKRLSSKKYSRSWYAKEVQRIEKRSEVYRTRLKELLARQAKTIYSDVAKDKKIKEKANITRQTTDTMVVMQLWIRSQVDRIMQKRFGNYEPVKHATKGIPLTKSEWLATEQGRLMGTEAFEKFYKESLETVEGMYATMDKVATELFADPLIAKQEAFAQAVQRAATSANTTWQTEFTRHFADAQEEWRKENLTEDIVPGFEFMNPNDEHTTPICAELVGGFYKYSDPRLKEIQPPLHPNCRSFLSPVDISEVKEKGIEFEKIPGRLI